MIVIAVTDVMSPAKNKAAIPIAPTIAYTKLKKQQHELLSFFKHMAYPSFSI